MDITLKESTIKKCKSFAQKRMSGSKNLYAYRGELNESKMLHDIVVGTAGEWAVYDYLLNKNISVGKPDLTIYEKKRKSFSADLLSDCGAQFHVKSQDIVSSKKYGYSWLFQKTDKLLNKPTEQDYIVFVSVDLPVCTILGILSVKDLVDNKVLKEPKVPRYRNTKHAIYFDDIENSNTELWRF